MTTATDGFGTILAELEQGGGGGGGGVIVQTGNANIKAVRTGEVTNGDVGEGSAYNTIFGTGNGEGSFIAGTYNAILGGDSNYIDASYSVVAGGDFNWMQPVNLGEDGTYSCHRQVIVGGGGNQLQQDYGFIGGGNANRIYTNAPADENNRYSAIVAGSSNVIVGGYCFIGSGIQNGVGEDNEGSQHISLFSVIVGGLYNQNKGYVGFIGGGSSNSILMIDNGEGLAAMNFSTIVGGEGNSVRQYIAFIGGGKFNTIYSAAADENSGGSSIVGGFGNTAQGQGGFIGGGLGNRLGRDDGTVLEPKASVVGGGQNNTVQSSWSVVVGGEGNSIPADTSTQSVIAGGQFNTLADHHGFIGGGEGNLVLGPSTDQGANGFQAIAGGSGNAAYGQFNFIGGGRQNRIGDENEGQGSVSSVIAGGDSNRINPGIPYATIGGGYGHEIRTSYGTIPGGRANIVGSSVEGGEASGLQAKSGDANYQRAYAGGQFNGEDTGARQFSEVVFRGNTDGSDGSTVFLGSGGYQDNPTFAGFVTWPGKSYAVVAECLARSGDMSSYQVIRALIHMDNDSTIHNVAGTPDSVIAYGSPPAGWLFEVFADSALRVTFTVGSGNTQVVQAVVHLKVVELGVLPV